MMPHTTTIANVRQLTSQPPTSGKACWHGSISVNEHTFGLHIGHSNMRFALPMDTQVPRIHVFVVVRSFPGITYLDKWKHEKKVLVKSQLSMLMPNLNEFQKWSLVHNTKIFKNCTTLSVKGQFKISCLVWICKQPWDLGPQGDDIHCLLEFEEVGRWGFEEHEIFLALGQAWMQRPQNHSE